MKRIFALATGLLLSISAWAEPPSQESIEHLLTLTRAEALVGSVLQQVDASMHRSLQQSLDGTPLSAEGEKVAATFERKVAVVVREELSWEKLKPAYLSIYADSFTQEEIDGLIAFYDSPAGRAYVDKMPVVMQKSMNLMQERMGPLMKRMQGAMKEAAAEARAAQ
jgi:uncharacterized protein